VTERRVYQERLQEEQKAATDTSGLAVRIAEQDNAIRAAKARILALRSQVRAAMKVPLQGCCSHLHHEARRSLPLILLAGQMLVMHA